MIDKNLNTILKNPYNYITDFNEREDKIFLAKEQNDFFFSNEKGDIFLSENKLQEDNLIPNQNKKELILVMGILDTPNIKEIIRKKHKESILIIIEPSLTLMKTALNYLDLAFLNEQHVYLFADDKIENLSEFLNKFMTKFDFLALLKNIELYVTNYYQKYDLEKINSFIKEIRKIIVVTTTLYGNDIDDNLIGLKRNLINFKNLQQSRSVSHLKELFKNVPAIVVSAGPSLNQNIKYLKNIKNNIIIIAVDTILERLLAEGIKPHFVCSIERGIETYNYFYKNKTIPEDTFVVGPPVLYNKVFEENIEHMFIPLRNGVRESNWLSDKMNLNEDDGFEMGTSCAHVAFGLAIHMACSPIILVGQDLAYGKDKTNTHAGGTIYDGNAIQLKQENIQTEGYFGENVFTTAIWIQFKMLFEKMIQSTNSVVINATEGGAKINYAQQKTLNEAISELEMNNIDINNKLISIPKNNCDLVQIKNAFEADLKRFNRFNFDCVRYLIDLKKMKITSWNMKKKNAFIKQLNYMDKVLPMIMGEPLLVHNLQAEIIQYFWKINSVEDKITVETLKNKQEAQIYLLNVIIAVMTTIIEETQKVVDEFDSIKEVK